jgi:MFS family permease
VPSLPPALVVAGLGLTQIIGYGTSYYCFALIAEAAGGSFGVPASWLFGAFSAALLLGGAVAPWAGRQMDRRGAAPLMVLGSAIAALALAGLALAPNVAVFTLALIVLQMAAPLMLYDAAFTALVQSGGGQARARITYLTLIAGFASTLFWPLTAWLVAALDWRAALMIYAALNALVALPIHAVLAARRTPATALALEAMATPARAAATPEMPPEHAGRAFALTAGGFTLASVVLSAVLAQMVPVLQGLGLGPAALLVATLFGPAQVGVRFVNMVLGANRHPLTVTLVATGALPLAVLALALAAPSLVGAAVFAVLLGFGSGLKSIVQGTLPLALFGPDGYGARMGRMALARQVAGALAPFLFAVLMEAMGARAALTILALIGGVAVAAFLAIGRLCRPPSAGATAGSAG